MLLCTHIIFVSLLCILINSLSVYYLSLTPASARSLPEEMGCAWDASLGYYIPPRAGHSLLAPRLWGIPHGSMPPGAILDISGPSAPRRPSPHDEVWAQAVGEVEGRKEGHCLSSYEPHGPEKAQHLCWLIWGIRVAVKHDSSCNSN